MLYITGPSDTIKDLYVREGYIGTFADYQKKFAEHNPVLAKTLSKDQKLPPYTAVQLVTLPGEDILHSINVARIVSAYTPTERQTLRVMQEQSHDIPTSMTTMDVLEEFQEFLSETKKKLSSPIIPTPFYVLDRSLTNKSLIKMSGEGLKHAAHLKESSSKFVGKKKLFELMKKRDELNHDLLKLQGQKGVDGARRAIESQTKELTKQIRQLIPRNLNDAAKKYLHGFKTEDAKRLVGNSSSLKLAKKGADKIKATHLDRLNLTGLAKHQSMIKGFKVLGDGMKKAGTYVNYSLAAYAIADTYSEGGNVAKTTFREGTSLYAGHLLSKLVVGGSVRIGGLVIGSVIGDAAFGATLLVCYPVIGWIALTVAGAAVAGGISYGVKVGAEAVWDGCESGYFKEKALQFGRWIYNDLKYLGEQLMKDD